MSSFKIVDQQYWSNIWTKIDTKEQQKNQFKQQEKETASKVVSLNQYRLPRQKEDIPLDELEFLIEERASILSVDQSLPYDWAEVVTKTRAIVSSPYFNFLSLQELKLSLEYWCSDEFKVVKSFIEANWSLIDIFGCNASSPCKNNAQKGLLLLFEGSFRIDKVSNYSIEYMGRLGATCTFHGVKANRLGMKLVSEI